MCGIAGYLQHRPRASGPDLLAMSHQLRKRGPDCEGFYVDFGDGGSFYSSSSSSEKVKEKTPPLPEDFKGANLALVHRRLSIVDLSEASWQPMGSSCGRYVICFNGEIYNYQELRYDLESQGVAFRTTGDTEVLLELFVRHKEKCLEFLNGDFAFSVLDKEREEIFLARDRLGIKPLFYIHNSDFFLFASDIKTLISSGLYEPEVNYNGLYLSFFFGITPRPDTAFEDVFAIEPGTWLKVKKSGETRKERYWEIPHGEKKTRLSYKDAVDVLREKLEEAVDIRMRADVEVGTFMSGGVDSTTITAYAAKKHPEVRAFTLGQKGSKSADEVGQAVLAAKMSDVEHVIERIAPNDYLKNIYEITQGYEEPFYSVSPNFMISKLVRDNGVKVVLNGLGGDELFGGYQYYKFARVWWLMKPLRPLFLWAKKHLSSRLNKYFSVFSARTATQYHTSFFAKHREREVRKLFGEKALQSRCVAEEMDDRYCRGLRFNGLFDPLMYMDLKNYVGNHHVERTDQFTMMNSIEGRFPLLDHKLIEFSATLPDSYKFKNNVGKRILKDAARGLVPEECLYMKKKGFSLPLEEWMRGEAKDFVEEHIVSLKKRSVFENAIIDDWYEEFLGKKRSFIDVWHLVSVEMWFRLFIEKGFLSESR